MVLQKADLPVLFRAGAFAGAVTAPIACILEYIKVGICLQNVLLVASTILYAKFKYLRARCVRNFFGG